jgi:hypothetical protein
MIVWPFIGLPRQRLLPVFRAGLECGRNRATDPLRRPSEPRRRHGEGQETRSVELTRRNELEWTPAVRATRRVKPRVETGYRGVACKGTFEDLACREDSPPVGTRDRFAALPTIERLAGHAQERSQPFLGEPSEIHDRFDRYEVKREVHRA